jgi:octaprenyl-diphosphate synthase
MTSQVALLNRITYYIVNRTNASHVFVFNLKWCQQERLMKELIVEPVKHTATLVHDDVVDDSNRRRGFSRLMHCGK